MQPNRSGLEDLFWEILRTFEDLALSQYEAWVPPLATSAKRGLVVRLQERAPGTAHLDTSILAGPVRQVLAAARNTDGVQTLIVQGLVLETPGQAIYSAVVENPHVSDDSRRLASFACAASESVTVQVPPLLSSRFADGDHLFSAFTEHSHEILMGFDAVGEGVDRTFAEPFGLLFKDIAGTFVARLVPICTKMGMMRRKVVSHLAASFMGLRAAWEPTVQSWLPVPVASLAGWWQRFSRPRPVPRWCCRFVTGTRRSPWLRLWRWSCRRLALLWRRWNERTWCRYRLWRRSTPSFRSCASSRRTRSLTVPAA